MKNLPLLIGTLLITVALVLAVAWFFSTQTGSASQVADAAVLMDSVRNVKGQEQAKVTIVEFSDLQCPACRASAPLVTQITQKYPNDVRVIYRHFPLAAIHKNAQLAAQGAEVAAESGKFWEFHDVVFEKQAEWADLNNDQAAEKLAEYAAQLQIDKIEFSKKIQSDEVKSRVSLDIAAGNKLGVNSTPTFYVNGQKTTAPQLLTAVESLLK